MPFFLYDTLTKQKREFKPLHDNEVKLYTCGLTVYNFGHIGNFSNYISGDFLKRYLQKVCGYKVIHVRNITDVGHLVNDADSGEDKMLKGAREQNMDPWQLAKFYTEAFWHDCEKVGLSKPDYEPKATEHIQGMIEMIAKLIEKGFAYQATDGVYFSVEAFPHYGELSGNKVADLIAGARVEINEHKKHPADFALWKTDQPNHAMQWDSPWGKGYPGWHIECSAMSTQYLGEQLDIHTGGEDNIFPHHECEIAQTEGVTGKQFVNFWFHKRHLLVDGQKMSKSKGNFYTLADLHQKWIARGFLGTIEESSQLFKFLVLSSHYRSKLDFSFEALTAAAKSWERIAEVVRRLQSSSTSEEIKGIRVELEKYAMHFFQALEDDLNTPNALAAVFEYCAVINTALDKEGISLVEKEHAENFFHTVIDLFNIQIDFTKLPLEAGKLIEARKVARENKDFGQSDQLRDELLKMGVEVKDGKDGMVWRRCLI
ncbi:MAG: cysteine--tRNA ligase [Candidatus Abawacabacteria bacterium]|nr:cysteine--tRNA ligase [Candidatus Abawacabacteria bacterium]